MVRGGCDDVVSHGKWDAPAEEACTPSTAECRAPEPGLHFFGHDRRVRGRMMRVIMRQFLPRCPSFQRARTFPRDGGGRERALAGDRTSLRVKGVFRALVDVSNSEQRTYGNGGLPEDSGGHGRWRKRDGRDVTERPA